MILYVRMIIVTFMALFTSRIVLSVLGVDDFGLYNVVGGVVGLFAFLRTSMEKAAQRFLNVEMTLPSGNVNEVFCVNLCIHIVIAFFIFIIVETIGLCFFNNYINFPSGRALAANCVYQCVSISLCFTVLSVPYSAFLIAHERMSFYALVSVVDAILKLMIAFLLMIAKGDTLILYGILLMFISILNTLFYYLYCKKLFPETRFRIIVDKEKYKKVLGYVSWTLLGQISIIFTNQGNGILVNIFHSVVANASMGIGGQVNSAITGLTSNFQTAFNPQITKSYAERDYDYLQSLVFSTSKFSYIMLFVISLPIMINIDFILEIWLKTVPVSANLFCIWFLWNGILNALSAPLNFCVMSSGNIRNFQLVTSLFYISDLIILYILFTMGYPAIVAMYVKVFIMFCVLFVRLGFAQNVVPQINLISYFRNVLFPIILISILSYYVGVFIISYYAVSNVIISTFLFFFIAVVISCCIGLSKKEKKVIFMFVNSKLRR